MGERETEGDKVFCFEVSLGVIGLKTSWPKYPLYPFSFTNKSPYLAVIKLKRRYL